MKKEVYEISRKNILRKSEEPENLPEIKGYDFEGEFHFDEMVEFFAKTGFQASNLFRGIEIIRKMLEERDKTTIFLGYTSNIITSGLRDVIRYIVKNRFVDVIVTTTGGIEEDIMKCFGNFYLGDFLADGKELHKKGWNRAGNIYIPNNRYVEFERFIQPILEELYEEQIKRGRIFSASELIDKLGEKINNENSIYYWAHKNKIPVFCPGITDGAIGDNLHFFRYNRPDFYIDVAKDVQRINEIAVEAEQTGLIIIGAGIVKHHILNANMMRDGCKYAVYINNSQEFDGSDSGARPEEAISWGKIMEKANYVKIFGDATIIFPIIVSQTFKKWEEKIYK